MKTLLLSLGFLGLTIASALACQFDTDCSPGSQCMKSGYSIYGSCAGGINPGNSNDQQPVRYYNDLSGKKGNTCSFNTDCGAGGSCMKSGYSIYGVCQ